MPKYVVEHSNTFTLITACNKDTAAFEAIKNGYSKFEDKIETIVTEVPENGEIIIVKMKLSI